jgi:hypothetical protein
MFFLPIIKGEKIITIVKTGTMYVKKSPFGSYIITAKNIEYTMQNNSNE